MTDESPNPDSMSEAGARLGWIKPEQSPPSNCEILHAGGYDRGDSGWLYCDEGHIHPPHHLSNRPSPNHQVSVSLRRSEWWTVINALTCFTKLHQAIQGDAIDPHLEETMNRPSLLASRIEEQAKTGWKEGGR